MALLRFLALLALACLAWSAPVSAAGATEVRLRPAMEVARAPGGEAWTWLNLTDTTVLRDMPAGWTLHVDQVRFERIVVHAVTRDGHSQRIERSAGELGENWAPGGVLSFTVAAPGRDIARLSLGFQRIDDPGLLRKVSALTPAAAGRADDRWLLLMGLFGGLLVSAFTYNAFVYAGQRYPFQRWYLAWVAAALLYGVTWTNLAAFAFPWLAGPTAVRIDAVLVGVVVALGSNFLVTVLEDGVVPASLRRTIQILALASVLSGVAAASDGWIDPVASDRLLNWIMLACVGTSVATVTLAALRGSRVVWLYLIGWTPVIAVYACRSARNFGLAGQSDAIDMATFAAVAFESLVFSLVIADRFLSLRRQRDAAEASARGMEIEQETLRRAAHTDFLTGLGNRAFFHDRMRELFERGAPFTLFLLDVDYLKELNDRQGHDAGDALLRHIGQELCRLEDAAICCARIGGDEFALLCEGPPEAGEALAARIAALQGSLWARYTWSGTLSLSVGSASAAGAMSADDLFQRADIALYEAKKQGRGRRQSFDDELKQKIQTRLDLIKEAHWGLRRGEFVLHFQPIVDVRSSQLVSVEALLRWNHPTRGLIAPGEFHAVLADKDTGPALQQQVLALGIEELRKRPHFTGTLAINFTAMDLAGQEAAARLLGKLEAAGVAPGSLCVEVTESIILGTAGNDPAEALRVLHQAGVKIALDDFGTGYASLVHLKQIPVDLLKIDRSFIAGVLREGEENEAIVRAVLALGHGLDKCVVAEGIESVAQLVRLRELGCDYAQGYLFGRPSPAFPNTVAQARAAA